MKKISILSALLLSGILSQAQQYVAFPTADVQWTTVYYFNNCEEGPIDTAVYNYQLTGDTTLAGISYKKLEVTALHASAAPQFLGGIREDNQRVYYRRTANSHNVGPLFSNEKEFLLYDFNAAVGETVIHDTANSISGSVVQAIDSVLIDGSYRKRIRVSRIYQDYWVAGVGSTGLGLLSNLTPIPTCGTHILKSVCFTKNGNTVFQNPAFRDCDASLPLTSIAEKTLGAAIKIFPNPAVNREIRINNIMPDITLRITDYTGRILLTKALKQKDNVVQLPQAACYMLILSDKQGQIVRVEKITGG